MQKLSQSELDKLINDFNNKPETIENMFAKLDLSWYDLSWLNLSWKSLIKCTINWTNFEWADLSYCKLSWSNLSYSNLASTDLTYADLTDTKCIWCNLEEANLCWTNLTETDFNKAIFWRDAHPEDLYWRIDMSTQVNIHTVFLWTNLIDSQWFDLSKLSYKQQEWTVNSPDEHQRYIESKLDTIEKELSSEKEKTEILDKKVSEKTSLIKNRWEDRIEEVTSHFEKLKDSYKKQSIVWLKISLLILLLLWVFTTIIVTNTIMYKEDYKYLYNFAPIVIFLSTILYFCIKQYLQYNRYNQENSDKIALLHWYLWLLDTNDPSIELFAAKTAEQVFTVGNKKINPIMLDTILDKIKDGKELLK